MAPVAGFFGSRFTLAEGATSGADAVIHPARDNLTGKRVAVKIYPVVSDDVADRFRHEVDALRALHHPGIVRHVAHGLDAGRPFVAVEWVEGVDLARRLADGPLPLAEVRALASRLADVLAYLHRLRVVHRDVTPRAILLPGGDVASAKLSGFGWSGSLGDTDVARPGRTVGTPGYFAPERLRGERSDARADVFSLGCVLYTCVTGSPPFSGPTLPATLSKVLLDEPSPIEALRPETPPALANLIARMLSKTSAARPADGDALRAELAELDAALPALVAKHRDMSKQERVLVSLAAVNFDGSTPPAGLAEIAAAHGGRADGIVDRHVVLRFPVRGDGGSIVGVARAALEAQRRPGVTGVSVVTVHDEPAGLGRAIDSATAVDATSGVFLDDVTASLLPSRFETSTPTTHAHATRVRLLREGDALDVPRTIFGREPPLQGRGAELARIVAHTQEHLSSRRSGAVLVTGATGVGKSRVRQEALRTLASTVPNLTIGAARGDPERQSSPFDLVAGFLKRFAELSGGGSEGDGARLRARIERASPPSDAARIARHLGAILGHADETDPKLEAARRDPALLHDLVRTAFIDLLVAEASAGPFLVVLEDLHWADPPSLALFGEALRVLADKPFVLWALGLPALRPRLLAWPRDVVQLDIEVLPLGREPAYALASALLVGRADAPTIDDITARSLGVPLFIEELAIGIASGVDAELSSSLIAMLESRLLAASEDVRRVARAAALVGRVFWRGAIAALIPAMPRATLDVAITELETLGWFVEHATTRFVGERELGFRHDSMREAAEALDAEEDRALGHALAARWLEANGEWDPGVVAMHYARAGLSHVAADRFGRATALALAAGDRISALEGVGRGLSCATDPFVVGFLHVLEARIELASGNVKRAMSVAHDAMMELERAGDAPGDRWLDAAGITIEAAARGSNVVLAREVVGALAADGPATAERIRTLEIAVRALEASRLADEATPLRSWLEKAAVERGGPEIHARTVDFPPEERARRGVP